MSSARSRNKFCLSLDNSSSCTSTNTVHLNRWSEVVPPKTALTFAALWDPEEGMVTFSGAALLESESLSGRSDVFDDDYSQFISLDRDIDGGIPSDENTATLTTFQDVFKVFLRHAPCESREHLSTRAMQNSTRSTQARASSTFDGLDVYSHDVQLRPRRSVQLSCVDLLDMESSFRTPSAYGRLRLRSDLMSDSCRPELESEPSSGGRPSQPNSRFSATTTSTLIDVTGNAAHSAHAPEPLSERISVMSPVPEWPQPSERVSPAGSWPYLPHRRRVLRKRRPFDGSPTSTATTSPTTTSPTPSTLRKVRSKSSSVVPSLSSPSSSRTSNVTARPITDIGGEEERRRRFPRPGSRGPITPPSTPPNSPSKTTQSPRLKLRFALLPKRRSRHHQTSPDEDGWVCIEVTPVIRQHFIPDLGDD